MAGADGLARWAGRGALVTGASAGIGAAAAEALARAGLRVGGLARRAHLVEALSARVPSAHPIAARACDVSDAAQLRAAFAWAERALGGVDVLVSNAGVLHQGHISDLCGAALSDADVVATLDVNLKAPVLCARHALASMRARGVHGHIININSIAGHYVPFAAELNVYPSAKRGLTAFSAALAAELAGAGSRVKVTNLSPGLVATDMSAAATAATAAQFAPLRPRDVADALLYVLATPPHVNITELTIQPVAERRL